MDKVREEAILKLNAHNRAFSLLMQRDPALAYKAKKDTISRALIEAATEVDHPIRVDCLKRLSPGYLRRKTALK